MKYEVIGKTCNCSGKETNMILRTINEKEIQNYKQQGMDVHNNQAVFACPICGATIINWLFLNQDVRIARWALNERYCFKEIKEEQIL